MIIQQKLLCYHQWIPLGNRQIEQKKQAISQSHDSNIAPLSIRFNIWCTFFFLFVFFLYIIYRFLPLSSYLLFSTTTTALPSHAHFVTVVAKLLLAWEGHVFFFAWFETVLQSWAYTGAKEDLSNCNVEMRILASAFSGLTKRTDWHRTKPMKRWPQGLGPHWWRQKSFCMDNRDNF